MRRAQKDLVQVQNYSLSFKGALYTFSTNLGLSIYTEHTLTPFVSGEYNKFYKDGVYLCAGCESPLYESETKFDSGCGWPAFYKAIDGALDLHVDKSLGAVRTEICCATCGGHIGHVFKGEGYKTPIDERHCANSISLKFKPVEST